MDVPALNCAKSRSSQCRGNVLQLSPRGPAMKLSRVEVRNSSFHHGKASWTFHSHSSVSRAAVGVVRSRTPHATSRSGVRRTTDRTTRKRLFVRSWPSQRARVVVRLTAETRYSDCQGRPSVSAPGPGKKETRVVVLTTSHLSPALLSSLSRLQLTLSSTPPPSPLVMVNSPSWDKAPLADSLRIAVVGAGLGGSVAALALARRGFSVTVFEAAPELRGALTLGFPVTRDANKV